MLINSKIFDWKARTLHKNILNMKTKYDKKISNMKNELKKSKKCNLRRSLVDPSKITWKAKLYDIQYNWPSKDAKNINLD